MTLACTKVGYGRSGDGKVMVNVRVAEYLFEDGIEVTIYAHAEMGMSLDFKKKHRSLGQIVNQLSVHFAEDPDLEEFITALRQAHAFSLRPYVTPAEIKPEDLELGLFRGVGDDGKAKGAPLLRPREAEL